MSHDDWRQGDGKGADDYAYGTKPLTERPGHRAHLQETSDQRNGPPHLIERRWMKVPVSDPGRHGFQRLVRSGSMIPGEMASFERPLDRLNGAQGEPRRRRRPSNFARR